jgi:prepilin-type N-terminal cleavage/methylation domain-containing protein/prepilin-type processing-associated H-X9-DG protein
MQRRAFTLVELLLVVVIIAVLTAILYPGSTRSQHAGYDRRSHCQTYLKQISLGMLQYVEDYDGVFPPVSFNPNGHWVGLLQPYVKDKYLFRCPSVIHKVREATDYFFNGHLVQLKNDIPFPASTLMFGDGQADSPQSYTLVNLSREWRQDYGSPCFRHVETANYAFVDGHVKPLKPHQVTIDPPGSSIFTFTPVSSE